MLALARRGDSNPFVVGIARHALAQLLAERTGRQAGRGQVIKPVLRMP